MTRTVECGGGVYAMERSKAAGAAGRTTRVHMAALRRLLRGHETSASSLSRELSLPPTAVEAALDSLQAAGAIHRADGKLIAAYPLSGIATDHRLSLRESTAYACCAIDALAVPFMADDVVRIESSCSQCAAPLTITLDRDRILAAHPADPVVFHVARECCQPGPAVVTRCPLINFFCGRDHAAQWLTAHPECAGDLLMLSEAISRAREIFATLIDAFQSDRET